MSDSAAPDRCDPHAPAPGRAPEELMRVVSFLEAVDSDAEALVPLARPDPVQRMSLYLLRRHFEAKPVTVTSLALASGVPYATAMRRIDEMIAGGLVRRRPKGMGRKTFLLNPDPRLIEAWRRYAERLCQNAGRCLGTSTVAGRGQPRSAAERLPRRVADCRGGDLQPPG